MISRRRQAYEPIFPAIDALDLELLPGFDVVLPPELRGDDDLALGGNGGFHTR
jgi:hypothetical protein